MKALILTEGGRGIGFGHLTRCLALYDEFRKAGVQTEFLINADVSAKVVLKNKKYTLFNWLKNKNQLEDNIKRSDIVVIDSYLADIDFYRWVSRFAKVPAYIDDYKRLNYPRGMIINGSAYAKSIKYKKRSKSRYLLGPKYAYLRKNFSTIISNPIKKDVQSMLITFGGADHSGITYKILTFLQKEYPLIKKNVIITKDYKYVKEITGKKDALINVIYQPGADVMAQMMTASDIAISAGGQTLYELARCGTPTIGICVARNQKMNLLGLKKAGFLKYAGWYNSKNILKCVNRAIKSLRRRETRLLFSRTGRKMIDGYGARRIIDFLITEAS